MNITKEKIIRYWYKTVKNISNAFLNVKEDKEIIFVLGYGRSGTSIMINLLHHFYEVDAHGENSEYFMDNYILDKNALDDYLLKCKYGVVALKPILNSYEGSLLLERYKNAKIVWLYRDYRDVIYSARKKFGDRVALEMKEYIIQGRGDGWISQFMPEKEKGIIRDLDTSEFTLNDWMAVVWWSVNNCIISQELYSDNRVFVVSYDDLVNRSASTMDDILSHISLKHSGLDSYLKSGKQGKGKSIKLSMPIAELCEQLNVELNSIK